MEATYKNNESSFNNYFQQTKKEMKLITTKSEPKLLIQGKNKLVLKKEQMQKGVFFLLASVIVSTIGFGQGDNDTRGKLAFGAKIGGNYSNVYDAQGEDFEADPKLGLALGVFASIPLGKMIGVQPELLFSQKGFKASGMILGGNYSFTRTTSYLDVPLLLAIKPVSFFTILVGPQYSYLLKEKNVFTSPSMTYEQEKEFDNDNIRKNTLGFMFGFDVNVKNLVVGARAAWDFQTNHGDGSSSTPRYKNTWFQATVGYRLH